MEKTKEKLPCVDCLCLPACKRKRISELLLKCELLNKHFQSRVFEGEHLHRIKVVLNHK